MRVDELLDLFVIHARQYYRRADGAQTRHAANLELGLRPLRSCREVESFSLRDLIDYRESLIRRGLTRRTINQWVGWVRLLFRWAAQHGHCEPSLAAELMLLDPLRHGRSAARESRPRVLVTPGELVAVADAAPSTVGRMLRVQWLAGMRPGEVCAMRRAELEQIDDVVVYRPAQHKNAWRGRSRLIVLNAEAFALVGDDDPCFAAAPGRVYAVCSYAQAVRRACRRIGARCWTPGLVRRSSATYARRIAGAEVAQRLLGHATSTMTERYYDLEALDAIEAVARLVRSGWTLSGKS